MRSVRFALRLLLPFGLLLAFGVQAAGPVEQPPPLLAVWDLEAADGCFGAPKGITLGDDGFLYVADTQNDRIQQFDLDGEFVSKWGMPGEGEGRFDRPTKVAFGPLGDIYVAEVFEHRIQRFDEDRNYVDSWGEPGTTPGQFQSPRGIATDAAGYVYVADQYNHRIQKFSRDGTFVLQWGGMSYPHSVAVDSAAYIYVTERFSHRVRKFTATGAPVATWGSYGTGPSQFRYPEGIHIGADDRVYVADTSNRRVQVFDLNGGFLRALSTVNIEYHFYPEDLAADSSGRVHVIDGETVMRLTSLGELDLMWGCRNYRPSPTGVVVAPDGTVHVSDDRNNEILTFSAEGERLSRFGSDLMGEPLDVAITPDGTIYAADAGEEGVWKFPFEGEPELIDQDRFDYPWGASCDSDGYVYVADEDAGALRIDPDGNVDTDWFYCDGAVCDIDEAYDTAVAPDGTVYVTIDLSPGREVWAFDTDGQRIATWGARGSGEGEFDDPYGIAVAPDGSVLVTDQRHDRIQKFSADGDFQVMWGSSGSDPGQFDEARGISVGVDGKIYVADDHNYRIQIFGFPITHDYFSTDTTQSVRPCGEGLMTLFNEFVYEKEDGECEIDLFTSFLPFQIGLDALHLRDTTALLFSVDQVGHVVNDGDLMTLYPNVVYLWNPETQIIKEELNLPAEGVNVGDVNALYDSGSGRYTFTVDRNTRIRFNGNRMTLRPCRTYVFDPPAGTLDKVFNGCKIGLTDIDAFHVVSGDRFAFSTASDTFLRLGGKLVHLYPQNGYIYDVSTGELVKVFDGADIGLDDLDGLFLAPGAR